MERIGDCSQARSMQTERSYKNLNKIVSSILSKCFLSTSEGSDLECSYRALVNGWPSSSCVLK